MQNEHIPQPEITTYTTAEVSEQTVFCGGNSIPG